MLRERVDIYKELSKILSCHTLFFVRLPLSSRRYTSTSQCLSGSAHQKKRAQKKEKTPVLSSSTQLRTVECQHTCRLQAQQAHAIVANV